MDNDWVQVTHKFFLQTSGNWLQEIWAEGAFSGAVRPSYSSSSCPSGMFRGLRPSPQRSSKKDRKRW